MAVKNKPLKVPVQVEKHRERVANEDVELELAVANFVHNSPDSELIPEMQRLSATHAALRKEISDLQQRNSELTGHLWEERKAATNHAELGRYFHEEIAHASRWYSSEQKRTLNKLQKDLDTEKKTAEAYLFVLERAYIPSVKGGTQPGRVYQMIHNVKMVLTQMVEKLWTQYRDIVF